MKRLLALLLIPVLLLSGCGKKEDPKKDVKQDSVFLAMDTVMTFSVYGSQAENALQTAQKEIERLESLLSVTLPDSQLWAINHSGGAPVAVGEDVKALLAEAQTIGDSTGGALDITLYPVVKAWGFTTSEYHIPDQETLDELLTHVDYRAVSIEDGKLTLPAGMEMDFGALAKGYAGQRCADLLKDMGVTSASLNLGGNVQTIGAKPDGSAWRIGIQDPHSQTGDYIGVVQLIDQAVVTSGGYQRYFEEDGVRYWHIIDPATGAPARSGLISATIIAPSGTLCDALSTSLFVLGKDKALDCWRERRDFETILIDEGSNVWITPGLANSFALIENSGYTLYVVEE